MEFLYTIKGNEVCVDKVSAPEAEVDIPARIEGLPVTELGPYMLAGSMVEEIHIPAEIRKIGAYAFYGCEKLRAVWCYGRAVDLGAGIFADDRQIAFLDLTLFSGERSGMKELLQEIRQTLRVQIHELAAPGEEPAAEREARLIFPEYFEESVENTPARKLMVETHGCGQRYRYCFVRREFQYADYDALFSHVQVQEAEELTAELAMGRLLFPRGLGKKSRERYETWLREHWESAARTLLAADRLNRARATNLAPGLLPWFVEEILAGGAEAEGRDISAPGKETLRAELPAAAVSALPGKLARITALAQERGDTEMVSYLMDYAHELRKSGREAQKALAAGQAAGNPEPGDAGGKQEHPRAGTSAAAAQETAADAGVKRGSAADMRAQPEAGPAPRRRRRFEL